ncbi:hypothetical protein EVAR_62445_1 [Eumeta japonica]|uniref:Uncharacterized protein n=1 Tax=Eumeta variegata TaxID=151549 RepID=A0A4C1Z1D2_EUMVA|nr:hypothetical protein EVAR_62445_1 [Eumeta japonica]
MALQAALPAAARRALLVTFILLNYCNLPPLLQKREIGTFRYISFACAEEKPLLSSTTLSLTVFRRNGLQAEHQSCDGIHLFVRPEELTEPDVRLFRNRTATFLLGYDR